MRIFGVGFLIVDGKGMPDRVPGSGGGCMVERRQSDILGSDLEIQ